MTNINTINKKIEISDIDLINYIVNDKLTIRDVGKLRSNSKARTSKFLKRIRKRSIELGLSDQLTKNNRSKFLLRCKLRSFILDEVELSKLIIDGYTSINIIEKMSIKSKDPHKLIKNKSTELGLWDRLHWNNLSYKNPSWHPYLIHEKFGDQIKTVVSNGGVFSDIIKSTGLPLNAIRKYFEFNTKTNDDRKVNSKKVRTDTAKLASLKRADI